MTTRRSADGLSPVGLRRDAGVADAIAASDAEPRSPGRRTIVERHGATTGGSRVLERTGVAAYRLVAAIVGRLPARPAWILLGLLTQASYLAWPSKRRWANLNFGHILGLPPDDPAVRRLALAAYRNYARYLVELMRLPRMPLDTAAARVEAQGMETLREIWRDSGSLILVAAHVGNNEFVAAGAVSHGLPINVLADDTTFPEMFDLLRRQRERWGVTIIPWRNIREIYAVLKRRELLGLLVDWGYRSDGIPVRLFGAWTTLPAGPAVLAAKTGATILPIVAHRRRDGTFFVTHEQPIRVASSRPEDLARATQAIADALGRIIAAAPEQWYSFKPLWPGTAGEREELARRAPAARPETSGAEGAG